MTGSYATCFCFDLLSKANSWSGLSILSGKRSGNDLQECKRKIALVKEKVKFPQRGFQPRETSCVTQRAMKE